MVLGQLAPALAMPKLVSYLQRKREENRRRLKAELLAEEQPDNSLERGKDRWI